MLIDSKGNDVGPGENLGWAPLAAILAPVGIAVTKSVGGAIIKKLSGGGKPPPPPCTFFQRLGRVFGSKPPCT